jgi:DNA (cytosine-5)-methyltransferase 1
MARLHGYPDWFRFHVTKWHGARQVGNSVPPPLARAVASKIIEAMGISPKRSAFAVNLGKEEFLRFEMSEAASTLGVLVPIARRDKKSGARKRKQVEIEDQHEKLRAARG